MKLSNKTIKLITDATQLACILQIDGIILDSDGIRGYNDEEGVIIAALEDFNFEFEILGLARLQNLKNKLNLLKSLDSVQVEAVPKSNNQDIIEKLAFKSGKIDFSFRCALPKTIKDIPKKVLNKKPNFYIDVTQEDVASIIQGTTTIRSANMIIEADANQVKFKFSDDTGDLLNYTPETELGICGDDKELSLVVNLKKMLPIFRIAAQSEKFRLNILRNNIVYVSVNDLDIFVIAEV